MDASKRKEIEDKEERENIEKWILKKKISSAKTEYKRRRLKRELNKYQ